VSTDNKGVYKVEVVLDLGQGPLPEGVVDVLMNAMKRGLATMSGHAASPFQGGVTVLSTHVEEHAPSKPPWQPPTQTLRADDPVSRRRKQPEERVWEHCGTEETRGAHRSWTPKQPNNDSSWELCAMAPLDNRPSTPFFRCFWKRCLP
jgi:hypothetical protein